MNPTSEERSPGVDVDTLRRALDEAASRLCVVCGNGKLRMRVPVDQDDDDLVLDRGLEAGAKACDEAERLLKERDAAKEDAEGVYDRLREFVNTIRDGDLLRQKLEELDQLRDFKRRVDEALPKLPTFNEFAEASEALLQAHFYRRTAPRPAKGAALLEEQRAADRLHDLFRRAIERPTDAAGSAGAEP